ncbi:alpha-protein kinase 3 [Suncus etruscus]|uniref:alpha-protein kinase 3 n=1 Tax=Suncus etruscus TaxID=109475 RepID=UPI00211077C5|nr:alpha-protein kinase 3 [Suncus etruscus]
MGSRRGPGRAWGSRSGPVADSEDEGPVWTPGPASRSYLLSVRPETSPPQQALRHTGEVQPLLAISRIDLGAGKVPCNRNLFLHKTRMVPESWGALTIFLYALILFPHPCCGVFPGMGAFLPPKASSGCRGNGPEAIGSGLGWALGFRSAGVRLRGPFANPRQLGPFNSKVQSGRVAPWPWIWPRRHRPHGSIRSSCLAPPAAGSLTPAPEEAKKSVKAPSSSTPKALRLLLLLGSQASAPGGLGVGRAAPPPALSPLGSTFCSIIAQLTEETQPVFETTLKSRAVSEDSDVRFTCVVTGYPEPEVTWYKDDTELDRYCGLPKYQITRQGKCHTLQLYRCQEDDAAIYQASAHNSKGIVSCSGVLEVGTMTEYKIHQRWFAKLKRKAVAKMREMEQNWRQGHAPVGEADALRGLSPDRFQRKRRLSGAGVPPESGKEGQVGPPTAEPGPVLNHSERTPNGEAAPKNGEDGEPGLLSYICEAMERGSQRAPQKESTAKKKKKVERPKPAGKRPEMEALVRSPPKTSENSVSYMNEADSHGLLGPGATVELAQSQPGGRTAHGPGSPGAVGAKISVSGTPGQSQDAPSPGPSKVVYFSLKDLYAESTQISGPPREEEPPLGKPPGQATNVLGQPPRLFNRKRFAPPKAQGKAQLQAAGTPTPPARHRHSSALQGPAGASGEAPASQTTQASSPRADRREEVGPAGHGAPESQVSPEPTDTAAQREESSPAGHGVGGLQSTHRQSAGQEEVGSRGERTPVNDEASKERDRPKEKVEAQGRPETRVERMQEKKWIQEDRQTQGDKQMQEERQMQEDRQSQGDRQIQEDRRLQKGRYMEADGKMEEDGCMEEDRQTQEDRQMQEDRTQDNRKTQEDGVLQLDKLEGGSFPAAKDSQPGSGSLSDLSWQPRRPTVEVSGPSEPTPAVSTVGERPGVLLASEVAPAPGDQEVVGLDVSCEDGLKPTGQVTQLDGSCLTPGTVPCVAGSDHIPAVLTPGVSIPTSLHPSSAAAIPPSGNRALMGPAPTSPPKPPRKSQSWAASAASSEGAHEETQGVDEASPGPRSCDPGLIDSLKNYLLLLLQLSGAEQSGGSLAPPASLVPTVEVAGLSPRTSRRILEHAGSDHLVQSAQTLLLTPRTSRRITGLLEREVEALDAARGSSTSLSVPAIVVGEESRGLGTGAPGKGTPQGPTPQESPATPLRPEGDLWGPLPVQSSSPVAPEAQAGIPAATAQELALGARPKRLVPKARAAGDGEVPRSKDRDRDRDRDSPTVSPREARKHLAPGSPGREKRSPTQVRRASLLEVPRAGEETPPAEPEAEPACKEGKQDGPAQPSKASDPLKAPQVIRKIRAEAFPDASGSLKLWCQFFNILSDSVLTWTKDQCPVGAADRSAGDEGPAALAIVRASGVDCGLYRCEIRNQHGAASTDFTLSPEVLSGFISREEGEVGEEIEMTPMVFAKGLADSGCWGDKLFGRLASEELRGQGRGLGLQKASQAKVIYGLEPIFESGRTCVLKVASLLVFGPGGETSLLGRNYDVTIQGCKIQNMSREYCKIFAAEARAVPGFGEVPEIIPLYLIYRPANNIPYATLEEDLGGPLETHCCRHWTSAATPQGSEAAHKCQTFQHWLFQWTNGGFLVTDLAGVGWKMTNVQIATKLRGYQGLKDCCAPALLDQFVASHRCSPFCTMLGLQPLKAPEPAHALGKAKGSKSPSSGRKGPQLSPQPQKRGPPSPQGLKKIPKARPQPPEPSTTQPPPVLSPHRLLTPFEVAARGLLALYLQDWGLASSLEVETGKGSDVSFSAQPPKLEPLETRDPGGPLEKGGGSIVLSAQGCLYGKAYPHLSLSPARVGNGEPS